MNKHPLKAAIITGMITFAGFSLITPLMIITNNPREWGFAFLFFFYFIISGLGLIGLFFAAFLGVISYLLFRFVLNKGISDRLFRRIVILTAVMSFVIGFMFFLPAKDFTMGAMFGKERIQPMQTIDDGKDHKWVHYNTYDIILEIDYDTNLDSKPDVWEYYNKNGNVYKKEIDTRYTGKANIREYYKNGVVIKKENIANAARNNDKK